jgi:hypothetical protein
MRLCTLFPEHDISQRTANEVYVVVRDFNLGRHTNKPTLRRSILSNYQILPVAIVLLAIAALPVAILISRSCRIFHAGYRAPFFMA